MYTTRENVDDINYLYFYIEVPYIDHNKFKWRDKVHYRVIDIFEVFMNDTLLYTESIVSRDLYYTFSPQQEILMTCGNIFIYPVFTLPYFFEKLRETLTLNQNDDYIDIRIQLVDKDELIIPLIDSKDIYYEEIPDINVKIIKSNSDVPFHS